MLQRDVFKFKIICSMVVRTETWLQGICTMTFINPLVVILACRVQNHEADVCPEKVTGCPYNCGHRTLKRKEVRSPSNVCLMGNWVLYKMYQVLPSSLLPYSWTTCFVTQFLSWHSLRFCLWVLHRFTVSLLILSSRGKSNKIWEGLPNPSALKTAHYKNCIEIWSNVILNILSS